MYLLSLFIPLVIFAKLQYKSSAFPRANCLQAESDEAQLLVFSGKTYPECLSDSWRYDLDYWGDWSEQK